MGLLDDLRQATENNRCKVQRWLDTLSEQDRKELDDAFTEGYPAKTIWRVIVKREGPIFSDSVFGRHYRGECGCGIQR